MRVSTLSARWFSFILLLIAGTVGCGQSGTGVPAPLTAPSSLSVPSTAALGPSAGYNASGTWSFVFTDVHGNFDGDFDSEVHQDPVTGDLTFLDNDDFPVTMERLSNGSGAIITYRVYDIDTHENGGCAIRVMGTVRLDTTTNTLTMPYRLKGLTCNGRLGGILNGTKIS
jgi:hypothetical protein